MRLTGYQPQYFPRLHYFARILDSDIFTISDYVQFVRAHSYPTSDGGHKRGKSYQAHTPLKTSQGIQFLAVPVKHNGYAPINQTGVSYTNGWVQKHLKGIQVNYTSSANFSILFPQLTTLIEQHYENFATLNIATIFWALAWILGHGDKASETITVDTINDWLATSNIFRLKKVIIKSQTNIPPSGPGRDATDWIIDTCHTLGADEYYHGHTAGVAYLDALRVKAAGITLTEQNWVNQLYTQQFSKLGFIPNLSILDLLLNENQDRVCEILKG